MSIFNEFLPKFTELSKSFTEKINQELQDAFKKLDEFEEECRNARGKARDRNPKEKYVMQSILEDEDPTKGVVETAERRLSDKSNTDKTGKSSTESDPDRPRRNSKKRNKNEVDGINSPEVEKRQKRNASVKAQTNISKQVNVNLTQKLRREDSTEKKDKMKASRTGKLKEEDDKENTEPMPVIKIKQEKISLPMESVEMESMAVGVELTTPVEVKQELDRDEMAMPPPAAPIPRSRKALPKCKSTEEETSEDEPAQRRSTRTRKQKESITMPPSSASRSLRASSRASKQVESAEEFPPPPEPRPKRTRAKKKVPDAVNDETAKETQSSQDSGIASPAEKPRAKRTRRAAKQAETKTQEPEEVPVFITTDEERLTEPFLKSPILQPSHKGTVKRNQIPDTKAPDTVEAEDMKTVVNGVDEGDDITLDRTRVIEQEVDAPAPAQELDQTVVLPKAVYCHDQGTPKPVNNLNETMVIRKCDETVVIDKASEVVMNATVVIDKDPKHMNITEDNSLLTDDSELQTPPKQNIPPPQPISAVKEKVQQFEELASRVTRTKTRAMAKNQEQEVPVENQTPPDKIVKQTLPMETLQKMNSMIFNGKPLTGSASASKPRVVNGLNTGKSQIPSSTSKLSSLKKTRETAEEIVLREKEDARKKKEAMLEAKKDQQRRRREGKVAAAAAAREAAQRSRQHALAAAARDRLDRQAHADLGKLERLKEVERKKQELARKVAVTEERRRAEEQARLQRLEEEQKRAEALRRKQLEESETWKKEAAIMAKEIEKKQKEYKEKQKMKQRFDEKIMTPLKSGGYVMEPVRMEDGFQYLNSDNDDDSDHASNMPTPHWCISKYRTARLVVQAVVETAHVDRLFSVRVHSPDLAEIFPQIERARLKRTSSAVWRTPPTRTAD